MAAKYPDFIGLRDEHQIILKPIKRKGCLERLAKVLRDTAGYLLVFGAGVIVGMLIF